MKYLVSLLFGIVVGVLIFSLGLYYNPFIGKLSLSPLSVTESSVIDLSYSAVPHDGLLFTNNGETTVEPFPERVGELWEPAIEDTEVWVTQLQNGRGNPAGLGIKFASKSEQTRLINGEALVNSAWHLYLPDQGTLLIDQTENYWTYLREIVLPARLGTGDSWSGTYHQIMTVGPQSLGTARVTGGSGLFAESTSESVESLTARAYSAVTGPVSMTGSLTMTQPVKNQ